MKIGYDAKRLFHNASGLGNYSRDLLGILTAHLPQHDYLLFSRSMSEKGEKLLNHPAVTFTPLRGRFLSRQLTMGLQAAGLKCDIFHGLSGELPLRWGNQNVKKVVTIHDLIFERYPAYYSWFDRKIHKAKFRHAAQTADVVVAISEQTKADIIHYLKIPESKIRVIYQGCSHLYKESYSEATKEAVRQQYALPPSFVLNVGTIEERKNGLALVKALKGTAIPLVFIGKEKKYAESIHRFIAENGMTGQVIFLKNVSNPHLAVIYQLARVFAYPSVYEGFGIPVIEALYSGTPVITNGRGVFPEAGGPASRYVQAEDHQSIRSALTDLWENEALRAEMAVKGREYAARFDDDKIAAAWADLYNSLR